MFICHLFNARCSKQEGEREKESESSEKRKNVNLKFTSDNRCVSSIFVVVAFTACDNLVVFFLCVGEWYVYVCVTFSQNNHHRRIYYPIIPFHVRLLLLLVLLLLLSSFISFMPRKRYNLMLDNAESFVTSNCCYYSDRCFYAKM